MKAKIKEDEVRDAQTLILDKRKGEKTSHGTILNSKKLNNNKLFNLITKECFMVIQRAMLYCPKPD